MEGACTRLSLCSTFNCVLSLPPSPPSTTLLPLSHLSSPSFSFCWRASPSSSSSSSSSFSSSPCSPSFPSFNSTLQRRQCTNHSQSSSSSSHAPITPPPSSSSTEKPTNQSSSLSSEIPICESSSSTSEKPTTQSSSSSSEKLIGELSSSSSSSSSSTKKLINQSDSSSSQKPIKQSSSSPSTQKPINPSSLSSTQQPINQSSSSSSETLSKEKDQGLVIANVADQEPRQGADPFPLVVSLGIGLLNRFLVPKPPEISVQAWQLLAIFVTTITGLVISPLPVGAWAFVALTLLVLTHTLTFQAAFAAFDNEVIWLIVISFFFARGFVKTGLGERVATYFVKLFGKSTLGLSYGLVMSEALLAPAMPSTTARAGGIFLPIIKSLALSAGPDSEGKSSRLGAYLAQSQLQASGSSSALFLTAAAQNLLCLQLAEDQGVHILNPWLVWFTCASMPTLASLLTMPLVLHSIFPPDVKDTPDAPAAAEKKLQLMGPISRNERVMIATMLLAITLWVFGDELGIPSVVAAMIGLSMLLLLGVLNWEDCLSEKSAWDTLAWFGVLVGMSGQLTNLGLVEWLSRSVENSLSSVPLAWPVAFGILQGIYFTLHYLFASQTGHVGALYSAFLAMQLAAGVPDVLAALSLAYNTSLFGALTHYSSGQAVVYYGAGYVELRDVFKLGAICGLWHCLIWSIVGAVWWRVLGYY